MVREVGRHDWIKIADDAVMDYCDGGNFKTLNKFNVATSGSNCKSHKYPLNSSLIFSAYVYYLRAEIFEFFSFAK